MKINGAHSWDSTAGVLHLPQPVPRARHTPSAHRQPPSLAHWRHVDLASPAQKPPNPPRHQILHSAARAALTGRRRGPLSVLWII